MKETNQEQGYREGCCRLWGSAGAFLRVEFLFSSGKDQEQSFLFWVRHSQFLWSVSLLNNHGASLLEKNLKDETFFWEIIDR